MKKTTIAIIGPHGAGKTTLGRAIAESCGCIFHGEIGARFRMAALRLHNGAHAAMPQQAFDERVSDAELRRDGRWRRDESRGLRVTETWHIGNCAYAAARGTWLSAAHMNAMAPEMEGAIVVPLRIERKTAVRRLRESSDSIADGELVDFFLSVADRAESIARVRARLVLEPICTDDDSVEKSLRRAMHLLRRHAMLSIP